MCHRFYNNGVYFKVGFKTCILSVTLGTRNVVLGYFVDKVDCVLGPSERCVHSDFEIV